MELQTEQTSFLFVYGTLRKDWPHNVAYKLGKDAEFIGYGQYCGVMYNISHYPGVVPSNNPKDWVQGEVYYLPEPQTTLNQLDCYEECGDRFPEPTEYVRKIQSIYLWGGNKILAWVYLYNWSTVSLAIIASGDFLNKQI